MPTKRQIVNEIQTLADEYLECGRLNFDNYMRLNKSELTERLETAKRMIVVKREVEELRKEYSKEQWHMVAIFPLRMSKDLQNKRKLLNDLLRSANDLWLMV